MKTIFNLKHVDPMSQPLFLGKDLGVQRYDVLHQYIDWLCMSRRKNIGLPYDNVGKNPIAGWTEPWMSSESVQVAPQEHEITSYKIGASKNDLEDMDFGDMKL